MAEPANPYHRPVLLLESIDLMEIKEGGTYVDVTFGGGGHSAEILKRLKNGRLIAFDRDSDAHENKIDNSQLHLVHADFKFIEKSLTELGIQAVDGILGDLGISSHQVDTPERGFSFRFDAELDMRMDRTRELSAREVVNEYHEEELYRIFRTYGEIQSLKRTVEAILHARKVRPIGTTRELEAAVAEVIPRRKPRQYLSQLFQALRIEVNGELESLANLLEAGRDLLAPGGRFVIISYHSLEDRMVKRFFRTGNLTGEDHRDFYGNPLSPLKTVTRKAIVPSAKEIEENPRARSARLRAAEKIEPKVQH